MIYLQNTTDPQDIYIPRQDRLDVEKTGIDLSAYLTSGQTIELIDEKVDEAISGITIDLSDYYTSAETNTAIAEATEDLVNSGEVQTQIEASLSGYATEQWVEDKHYLTEHQSLSAYSTTEQVVEMISGATENFVTSADVQTQIESEISGFSSDIAALSGKVQTDEEITAAALNDLNDRIPDMSNYYTSAQTESAIDDATSGFSADINTLSGKVQTNEQVTSAALNDLNTGKQETLVSGTNIKTINNLSLLGSGNIDIQGGGSGSESVVELTKVEYEALSAYAPDTTYVITDAEAVDLNDFATSGQVADLEEDLATVSAATETKATKASTTARSNGWWPSWNDEGIITGGTQAYSKSHNINGTNYNTWSSSNTNWPTIYAPTSAGTAGQIVTSNGSGAPVWTTYKFAYLSQSAYDDLATKDSTTIYFIIDEN